MKNLNLHSQALIKDSASLIHFLLRSVSFLQPDPSPFSSVQKVRREAKEQVFHKIYLPISPWFLLLWSFLLFTAKISFFCVFLYLYLVLGLPSFCHDHQGPEQQKSLVLKLRMLSHAARCRDITNHKYKPDNACEINLTKQASFPLMMCSVDD